MKGKGSYPPQNCILDDYLICKVVESEMSGPERARLYPMNFRNKGYINKRLEGTGRAAKIWDFKSGLRSYMIICGIQLYEEEGFRRQRLSRCPKGIQLRDIPNKPSSGGESSYLQHDGPDEDRRRPNVAINQKIVLTTGNQGLGKHFHLFLFF